MQKVEDEKQCLWKGNMCIEGEIILKYDNEAEKTPRKSLWQKDKPILSFPVLHPNRSPTKEQRQSQQRTGGKEEKVATSQFPCCWKLQPGRKNIGSLEFIRVEEKTLLMKGKGHLSLASSCTRCLFMALQPAVV